MGIYIFSDGSSYVLQLQLLFLADVNDSAIKNIEIQVWVILRLLSERYQTTEVIFVDEYISCFLFINSLMYILSFI